MFGVYCCVLAESLKFLEYIAVSQLSLLNFGVYCCVTAESLKFLEYIAVSQLSLLRFCSILLCPS